MFALGLIFMIVTGIGQIGCLIRVLVEMHQRSKQGLATAFTVLVLCSGIGVLLTFGYGWLRHREWGLTNIMAVWTCCWILGIAGMVLIPR
jgi:hypothetical protein